MKNKITTGTLALIAGVAIGWLATPEPQSLAPSEKHTPDLILKQLTKAGEIIDQDQKVSAVQATLNNITAPDLEKIAPSIYELSLHRPDMRIREKFLTSWGTHAPLKALAYSELNPHYGDRSIILKAWARANPESAIKHFQPSDKELKGENLEDALALLGGIAETDPTKAILFAEQYHLAQLTRLEIKSSPFAHHPSIQPEGSYQIAIERWMVQHPESAFKLINSLQSIKVREQAMNELFYTGWGYDNPKPELEAILQLWDQAQEGNENHKPFHSISLIETLATNLSGHDLSLAFQRALNLINPEQRLAAIRSVLYAQKWNHSQKNSLTDLADFIAARLTSDEITTIETTLLPKATAMLAQWITEADDGGIEKATTWIESLPAGKVRNASYKGIMSAWSWLPEKQKELVLWADSLPPSHQRDTAITACVEEISHKEPARAINLAATIENPTLRAEALAQVGARCFSKEEGGDKVFDLQKWIRKNPKLAMELQAARTPK